MKEFVLGILCGGLLVWGTCLLEAGAQSQFDSHGGGVIDGNGTIYNQGPNGPFGPMGFTNSRTGQFTPTVPLTLPDRQNPCQ